MKILQYTFIVIILHMSFLFPGDYAYPLENGTHQRGVFQPIIFGIKNNLEVCIHPILFLIKPNVQVKKFHGEFKGIGLASRYSFNYPTQL